MRNFIYNEALQINENHVIESSDFMLIKNWYSSICRQQKELRMNRSSFSEKNLVNVFKKTLNMKYNTYRLIQMVNQKKRGIAPEITKEHLFLQKAEEMLDAKTYSELMQITEFDRILDPEEALKASNESNQTMKREDRKHTRVVFNKVLGVSTEDVKRETDIELLTTWFAYVEFQIFQLDKAYRRTNEEKLSIVIGYNKTFKQAVYDRLFELKTKMLKDADIPALEIDESHMRFITRKFCRVAQDHLTPSMYEQILTASQINN